MLDIEIRIGLNQNEKIGVVTIFLRIEERKGKSVTMERRKLKFLILIEWHVIRIY